MKKKNPQYRFEMRVDNQHITLDPKKIQTSPRGKKFRVVEVGMDLSYPPKQTGGMNRYHWIVTLKFLESGRFTKLYFDYNDRLMRAEKI